MSGFAATLTDINFSRSRSGCTGNIKSAKSCWNPGIHIPNFFACSGIYCYQAPIESTNKNFALVNCNATIVCWSATSKSYIAAINFRIIGPNLFAGYRIQCINNTPAVRHIHDAIHYQRGALHSHIVITDLLGPGKSQSINSIGVDLG